jgi:alanine-glyoxylate transaminase/serine-glyoxylate transaminase/serine-pyruvate transaminase
MSINAFALNDNHRIPTEQLQMPPRLLLGAGPSNPHPRVTQALIMGTVGHLDPTFITLMDEVKELLRYAWQTENEFTTAVSGTGSAAMEAGLANLVEPGDRVLVGLNGYFGTRLVDMASRYGADVRCLERPWGEAFTLDEIQTGLETHRPAILALVHAETSTGVCQPLEGIAGLCRDYNCLLLVDTVTSLGGVLLLLDEWGVDIAYSCSQKCLACPPGLGPLTIGPRAMAKLARRQTKVPNWYLDVTLLNSYWSGEKRAYHHTAPIQMNYALREGLRLVAKEGLAVRWERHQAAARLLWDGLAELGLECHVPEEFRLPTLTTVRVPDGVDAAAVARRLLTEYNIEISGGLGQLAGKIWRIGLMGFNARPENVLLVLKALERVLN